MHPPFQRNFTPSQDAANQPRPRFYQAQPKFRPAPQNFYREHVIVRTPNDSLAIGERSLPLKEVNELRRRTPSIGIGQRLDRTSVKAPIYGPLHPMVVSEERFNKGNYSLTHPTLVKTFE